MHLNSLPFTNCGLTHIVLSRVAVIPLWKFAPWIEISVVPVAGPWFDATLDTLGGARKLNVSVEARLDCPSGLVTTNDAVPAAWLVVKHSKLEAVCVVGFTVHADPSNFTVETDWNPDPVTINLVPPLAGPFRGVNEVIEGGPS